VSSDTKETSVCHSRFARANSLLVIDKEYDAMKLLESSQQERRRQMKERVMEDEMLDEYDFSDSVPNPYYKHLKKQVTIRLDAEVVDYFKNQSKQTGLPYQSIINLYLSDCVRESKKLTFA
jgi:uncharacterized protein (DUF4415 family)